MSIFIKRVIGALSIGLLFGLLFGCGAIVKEPDEAEWISLFDGKTMKGWIGANQSDIGSQWQVLDGNMVLTEEGGGDITTVEKFSNFELSLEWKISEKGNSGIMYRVINDGDPVWMSGVEYQILDNNDYPGLTKESHKAGAVFDMYAPVIDAVKPVGEFNKTRIIVDHNHVEHWLNGQKVVEYEWKSDDWNQRLNNSKFKDWKNFGKNKSGYIALQDHGNLVTFRNIKIKKL